MSNHEKIARFEEQLNRLLRQQALFSEEIRKMQMELAALQKGTSEDITGEIESPVSEPTIEIPEPAFVPSFTGPPAQPSKSTPDRDWEQYIGGNLINKVGIAVLLIGLGLSVKYAIDKGLFPPVVRVVSGYLSGLALIGIAFKLRKKFATYSAVLFAGGMSVLYFTTFIGNTFFEPAVVPLLPAFIMMVLFTGITVGVAGYYNMQVVGVFGLAGAYAVPFLLNTGSEDYLTFFSYITIINLGVLILAAKKDWRAMTNTACLLTWVIFLYWMIDGYSASKTLGIAWTFASINFVLFTAALLAWQIRHRSRLSKGAITLIYLNSLIFYGMCMILTADSFDSEPFGLATLLLALVHFGISYLLYVKIEDKKPFLFLFGLGIFFVTIAIPIKFEIKTTILMWVVELLALFYISRKYYFKAYEVLAFVLGTVIIFTLAGHWSEVYYGSDTSFNSFWNLNFLTDLGVIAGAAVLFYLNKKFPKEPVSMDLNVILIILPVTLTFFTFFHEIFHWFEMEAGAASPTGIFGKGEAVFRFQLLWLLNYTMAFLAAAGLVNYHKWKNVNLSRFVVIIGGFFLLMFCFVALKDLNLLRDWFITGSENPTVWFILIRYVSYVLIAVLFYAMSRCTRHIGVPDFIKKYLPLVPHLIILIVLCNELVTWTFLATNSIENDMPHREGYSLLWGMYSLMLIGMGMRKDVQVLRLAGIALFAVTLLKVFLFDLAGLSILSRTLLFIGLGILLLVTSYLYQRFRENGVER